MIELTRALRFPLYDMLCRWTELRELAELTMAAAHRVGERSALALGHDTAALAHTVLDDLGAALTHATLALPLFREISDWNGECNALFRLHAIHRAKSNYPEAASCLVDGIALARTAGAPRVEANLLDNLGTVYSRMARFDEAIACHERGLRIREEQEHRLGVAASHENLAWTLLAAGSPDRAATHFRVAAAVGEEVGYLTLKAGSLWGLGLAEAAQANAQAAREARSRSVDVLLGLGAITADEAAQALSQATPEMPKALRRLQN